MEARQMSVEEKIAFIKTYGVEAWRRKLKDDGPPRQTDFGGDLLDGEIEN